MGLGTASADALLHVQGTSSGATLDALVLRNNATASGTATARFTNSTAAYNHASIIGTRGDGGALDFYKSIAQFHRWYRLGGWDWALSRLAISMAMQMI